MNKIIKIDNNKLLRFKVIITPLADKIEIFGQYRINTDNWVDMTYLEIDKKGFEYNEDTISSFLYDMYKNLTKKVDEYNNIYNIFTKIKSIELIDDNQDI